MKFLVRQFPCCHKISSFIPLLYGMLSELILAHLPRAQVATTCIPDLILSGLIPFMILDFLVPLLHITCGYIFEELQYTMRCWTFHCLNVDFLVKGHNYNYNLHYSLTSSVHCYLLILLKIVLFGKKNTGSSKYG